MNRNTPLSLRIALATRKSAMSCFAAAHAAELEAKDRRIAELEAQLAELERLIVKERIDHAELAKRELPPLPTYILDCVKAARDCDQRYVTAASRDLLAWVDTHYPAPVPQWERDAQMVEAGAVPVSERKAIAARIREAGRGSK